MRHAMDTIFSGREDVQGLLDLHHGREAGVTASRRDPPPRRSAAAGRGRGAARRCAARLRARARGAAAALHPLPAARLEPARFGPGRDGVVDDHAARRVRWSRGALHAGLRRPRRRAAGAGARRRCARPSARACGWPARRRTAIPGGACVNAWIYGVGTTRFGRQPTRCPPSSAGRRSRRRSRTPARRRRGSTPRTSARSSARSVSRSARCRASGSAGIPIVTVENACASGATALHEAAHSIDAGRYEHVLALGVEHLTAASPGRSTPIRPTSTRRPGCCSRGCTRCRRRATCTSTTPRPRTWPRSRSRTRRHGVAQPARAAARPLTREEVLALADDRRAADAVSVRGAVGRGGRRGARRRRGDRRATSRSAARRSAPGGLGPGFAQVWGCRARPRRGRAGLRRSRHRAGGRSTCSRSTTRSRSARSSRSRRWGSSPTAGAGGVAAGPVLGRRRDAGQSLRRAARARPSARRDRARADRRDRAGSCAAKPGAAGRAAPRIGVLETMGGGVGGLDGNACVVGVLEAG